MTTILVTAYDVNPYKGSESGMGWNFIAQLSRFFSVHAVTRENNREHIETYLREHGPLPGNVVFHYYDLPQYARFWKRGQRGSSLYFYIWQLSMPWFVASRQIQFDIAHNLNFHADWAPSSLWVLGRPLVWGPVGHHPLIPRDYVKWYGWSEYAKDRLRWVAKLGFWHLDPFLALCRRNATMVLCMNSSVAPAVGIPLKKARIHPSVGSQDSGWDGPRPRSPFRVLSVGRFVPLKGFDIALRSFARFVEAMSESERSGVEFVVVGSGPHDSKLRALCESLGVSSHVKFIEWMKRSDLLDLYKEATVFLFPSHEGAGMVIAEALSFGLPVVCFENVGPGELVDGSSSLRIPYGDYDATVSAFADALEALRRDPVLLEKLSLGARGRFESWLDWDAKGDQIKKLFDSVLERGASSP